MAENEMNLFTILALIAQHAETLYAQLNAPVYVEDLTEARLKEFNVEAVIFDHDGVLGSHKSSGPDETGVAIVRNAVNLLGADRVFILSNTRSYQRQNVRGKAYDSLALGARYIRAKLKPDPEGLERASRLSGVPVENIGVIDDGLFTGVLMAASCGAKPVYAKRRHLKESLSSKIMRTVTTWPQIAITGLLRFYR